MAEFMKEFTTQGASNEGKEAALCRLQKRGWGEVICREGAWHQRATQTPWNINQSQIIRGRAEGIFNQKL